MPNKKFSGMILCATGLILLILSLISDFLRGKQFLLGMAQIGLMGFGFLLFVIGILIVNNHLSHLMHKAFLLFFDRLRVFGFNIINKTNASVIDKRILFFSFIFLTLISCTLIAYLKIDTFNSWRYTSDLFTFHTVVQELALGNFGLEFTWGNIFGEHGYLFFFLIVPFIYIFRANTIYLLLLSGPFLFGISSIIFYLFTRQINNQWRALSISTIFLLGFSHTYKGLFEVTYGMHPDTYSGYLAVIMTIFLIWKYRNETSNMKAGLQTAGVYFFSCYS